MAKSCVLNVRVGIHQKLVLEHLGYPTTSSALRHVLSFFEFVIPDEYKGRVLVLSYRQQSELAKLIMEFMNKNV